jgi:hypothetical protein
MCLGEGNDTQHEADDTKKNAQVKRARDDPHGYGHDTEYQAGNSQSLACIATLLFHSVRYYTKYREFAWETEEKEGKNE